MRSIKSILILVVFLLASVSAYAGTAIESASQQIDLFGTGHADAGDVAEPVGLSPKVRAYYMPEGADNTNQYYGISTGHEGGDTVYGAASNSSNVFSRGFSVGDSADLDTQLATVPGTADDAESVTGWTGGGWSLL